MTNGKGTNDKRNAKCLNDKRARGKVNGGWQKSLFEPWLFGGTVPPTQIGG
jgi:hypothetical protein